MKLGEVCDIVMGQSPKGDTYNSDGEGIPLLNGPTEFGSTYPSVTVWTTDPKKICEAGDLIFCVRGSTTGRMNWADQPYCLGRGVGAFRAKSRNPLDLRFIYDQIVLKLERLLRLSAGSVFPNLSAKDFHSFEIDWPETQTRHVIASTSQLIDDKIENNRRMNETLEEMARAIFKSWFVDFDPVHAKAEGKQPVHMDAETAALFPSSFGDDGLPEGWSECGLDEIADFLNGLALQKFPPTGKNDLPVIKIAELRNGLTDRTDRAARSIPSKYVIDDGDVIFSWSGSLLQKQWADSEGALNQHLFKVTSETHPKWFHYYWTDHHMRWFQSIASSKATTMGHIQRKHLSEATVNCPPIGLIETCDSTISHLLEKQLQNAVESKTLAQLRDTLLPKLMSGEIRVKDAEQEVEAIA